jgi:hypothetical protein
VVCREILRETDDTIRSFIEASELIVAKTAPEIPLWDAVRRKNAALKLVPAGLLAMQGRSMGLPMVTASRSSRPAATSGASPWQ